MKEKPPRPKWPRQPASSFRCEWKRNFLQGAPAGGELMRAIYLPGAAGVAGDGTWHARAESSQVFGHRAGRARAGGAPSAAAPGASMATRERASGTLRTRSLTDG